jgi:Zn-dependent protease with chaperone function
MSNIQTSPLPRAPETPLQGAVMLSLVASATAITILFYGFCLFALALIGVLLLLDIALLIALARFGMHEYMIEPIRDQTRLAGFIFQSLNLGRAPDEGLPLSREEAPRLWAMVTAMAQRVGVPLPDVLLLQMDANAWVQLRGYRKGRGSCTLGVGFDLLAIFTQTEMEAVIAHEMAHAKLIQRGYRGWLSNGITRIGRLAYMLGYAIAHARDNNKRFWTARFLYRGSELLGKTGSRLVAAYSRQDEFAADRVAAELCGSALYRQALLKVHVAGEVESEVQMDARARLLQLQREGSYSQWVRDLRLPATPQKYDEVQQKVLSQDTRDEFDTHPILSDRLAALPPTRSTSDGANEAPALQLLDDADAVAARLLAAWEWRVDEEERKESEHLRRWIRKKARATYRTPGQYLGLTILVCGVLALLIALVLLTDNTIAISQKLLWLVLSLVAIGGGWWLNRLWRWQEKSSLPVPSFAAWRETSTSEARQTNPNQWMDSLQSELRAENPLSLQKRSDAAAYWGEESYRALQACDYRRALACSSLSLEACSQNLNGLLSGGVAAAYFGAGDAAQEMLGGALQRFGLGPSVSWALGWGLTLLGQYDTAEPYLLDARNGAHGKRASGRCWRWHSGSRTNCAKRITAYSGRRNWSPTKSSIASCGCAFWPMPVALKTRWLNWRHWKPNGRKPLR